MNEPRYTSTVGQKFNKDGSVRTFPGNTVISKITPDMPVYKGLVEIQDRLEALDSAGRYGFLPPSSFHMTVIEGVCDQVRDSAKWSSMLPLDMPLEDVTRFVLEHYRKLSPPRSLRMRINRASFARLLLIILEPADDATAQALRKFRDQFANETGIRFKNHDTYTFHISLAYRLIEMTEEQERPFQELQDEAGPALRASYPVIEMNPPVLTTFENMFRFDDIC